MTADDIRRLMARVVDGPTLAASHRNERVAWHAIRYLRAVGALVPA